VAAKQNALSADGISAGPYCANAASPQPTKQFSRQTGPCPWCTFSGVCFWDWVVDGSVLISFRLYSQTLFPDLEGDTLPTPYPYCLPHFVWPGDAPAFITQWRHPTNANNLIFVSECQIVVFDCIYLRNSWSDLHNFWHALSQRHLIRNISICCSMVGLYTKYLQVFDSITSLALVIQRLLFCIYLSFMLTALLFCTYTVSQKRRHYTLVHIFAKYWPIFIILSPTHSVGNLQ